LAKNSKYWGAPEVQLDQITFIKADTRTAFQMYKNNEIDWLGRPTSPWDLAFTPYNNLAQSTATYTVYWYVFNVQSFPFHNKKLRQAIAHTIDRKKLLSAFSHIGSPAVTPLPASHTQHLHLEIPESSSQKAIELFEQALQELNLTREQFPAIHFRCPEGEIRNRMTQQIKQQIEEILGIKCQIQVHPWEDHFEEMANGNFQLGSMGWTALIDDPLYTLNAFKYAHEKINFPRWEHPEYRQLLDQASKESDPVEQKKYLFRAEGLLIEETPIIPVYYEIQQYVKKKHIHLPANWEVKDIDFKWVSISEGQRE
jgi:oligopeptide transport system substrate-binding protein